MSHFYSARSALFRGTALVLLGLFAAPQTVRAQSPAPSHRDTLPTSADNRTGLDADDAKIADGPDGPPPRTTAGVSVGALSYGGGRSEQATSATLRWHALPWLSMGVTPTFVRSVEPVSALRVQTTRTGLTDLPLEFTAEHSFDVPLSPVVGTSVGVTLPLGDSATGFGAGKAGSSMSLSAAIAPTDRISMRIGAGRSLSDVGVQSGVAGAGSGFGDAALSVQATSRISVNAGVDGEIGQVDPTARRTSSLTGGISISLPMVSALSMSASHGISGLTPNWSIAIGVGTEFAAVGRTTVNSTSSRLRRAFGGGARGKRKP